MSDDIRRIQDWLRAHEDDLLRDTVSMLRIPSIESEPAPGAPFGEANREALEFALKLADSWGMKTKNIDGYVGYAEFGEGPLVMSLGHLDVVPVGPGWKHDPFGAEIQNGYIYARGAVDDKGPTMASFYAARAIMESVPSLGARIRQVFGCNEESGFACVHRYMQTEEPPALGIAPDSMWPCVFAEKGICSLVISVVPPNGKFQLLEVKGGQRPNIVIDSCIGRVRVASEIRPNVEAALADAWDRNVTWSWSGDELHVESAGRAAHGSTPYFGDSAATRLFRFLLSLAPSSEQTFYRELFNSTQTSGVGIGINGQDEISGDLTCNLGIVRTEGNAIRLTFNVRYPVSWEGAKVRDLCLNHLETLESEFKLESMSDSKPLYFKPDHPLVATISDVCEIETGVRGKPGVMGGGTYARAIPNSVSVGTSWEGDGGAHETDEHYKVENLYRASRIYAHILYRLCHVAQGKAAVTLTTSGRVNE